MSESSARVTLVILAGQPDRSVEEQKCLLADVCGSGCRSSIQPDLDLGTKTSRYGSSSFRLLCTTEKRSKKGVLLCYALSQQKVHFSFSHNRGSKCTSVLYSS